MRLWQSFVAAVCLCCCAAADPVPVKTETLIVPPYPGGLTWKKITDVNNAEQIYFEWIPQDQPVNDIKDILVEQVFYKLKGIPADKFIQAMFTRISSACDRVRVNGPVDHVENGFPIAYAQEYCSHQKGTTRDVDIFIKVISGKDALYVVQREFHRPMDKTGVAGVRVFDAGKLEEVKAMMEAVKVANDWLGTVQLCPAEGATCPAPAP